MLEWQCSRVPSELLWAPKYGSWVCIEPQTPAPAPTHPGPCAHPPHPQFYLVFALASMYIAMLMTGWGSQAGEAKVRLVAAWRGGPRDGRGRPRACASCHAAAALWESPGRP